MRHLVGIFTALALSVTASVVTTANAIENQPRIKSEVVMKVGNTVNLFHSGTADVKKEICINDVIPVFREDMAGGHTSVKQVGKVKVVGYEGEHYFKAEVVSGKIKVGDIAKKEAATCLVQRAR